MRIKWQRAKPVQEKPLFKANLQITSPDVFLIDENGEQIGKISTREAISRADELGMDLVEVNPKSNPPVAKIADLGQLKYEKEKKIHKQKVQQKKVEIKNIRLSLRIGQHDTDLRISQAAKFLSRDDKIKLEIVLRGRERQHAPRAQEIMLAFVKKLRETPNLKVELEQPLTRQGERFTIILINKK
ncbi:MAG: translation initiation factor IF-3 [Planctomycetes bacterium]|jgi:translation initiation factor IF-3|nr:translation initiation factor IF-3 [Planctomycetota bacterium]